MKKIRSVQRAELEILKLIRNICDKYHIHYSLHGGTLLGAVRHGGFIPWDDDLDVIMDRNEYDRFIDAWYREDPEGYFLQSKETEEKYTRNFLKIRKENTTFLQEDDDPENMHTGVFIDVEPVDRLPSPGPARWLFMRRCFIYEIYSREYVPSGGTRLQDLAAGMLLRFTSHSHRMKACRRLLHKITSHKNDSDLQRIIVANYATLRRPMSAGIMDEYTTMKFEDDEFMTISGWEELLGIWYGDYMKMPPEHMQKPGHIPRCMDLEHDYKTIESGKNDF